MDREGLRAWVDAYERAWRTPGTDALSDLFAAEATYSPAPFADSFEGLESIARMWEAEREGPDETFTMTSEVVAAEADTGVVRVEVGYGDPVHQLYRDLWIVRLDDTGRCTHFEEWPFWPSGTGGTAAGGTEVSGGGERSA